MSAPDPSALAPEPVREGASTSGIERNWPVNCWWVVAHGSELGEKPTGVEINDGRVTYRQQFAMAPLAPVYAIPAAKPVGKPINRESWGTLLTPGVNHAGVDMHDPASAPNEIERFSLRIVHLTTPVSIGKTHYYWAMARDHGEPFEVEQHRAMADIVFGEDIGIAEATQAMARCAIDQHDAVEFSVAADRAAVQGRRQVAAMVKAERDH